MRVALLLSAFTCLLIALATFFAMFGCFNFNLDTSEGVLIILVCFIFGYGCAEEYDNSR